METDTAPTAGSSLPAPFFHRLVNALFLRTATYVAIAADTHAAGQAAAVVCLSSLAQSSPLIRMLQEVIGSWSYLVLIALGLIRWVTFTAITYVVARGINGRRTRFRPLLRCLGFADATGIVNSLALVTGFAAGIHFAVGWWSLAAAVVAVRAATGTRTMRAALIAALAFACDLALHLLINLATGPGT